MSWVSSRARRRRARELEARLRELDRLDRELGLGGIPPAYRPPPTRRQPGSALPGVLMTGLVVVGCVGAILAWHPSYDTDQLRRLLGLGGERLTAAPEVVESNGSYSFGMTQPGSDLPVGYDPCREINVVVNPRGAPPGYAGLVDTAVTRTAAATGLTFQVVGETEDRNFEGRGVGDPVLVAWADEDEVAELAGDVAGIGGSTAVQGAGRPRYVTGVVLMDVDVPGADRDGEIAQAIMDHEFGHLVGLGHVDDPGELMAASPVRLTYGPGDLEGLARIGSIPCG